MPCSVSAITSRIARLRSSLQHSSCRRQRPQSRPPSHPPPTRGPSPGSAPTLSCSRGRHPIGTRAGALEVADDIRSSSRRRLSLGRRLPAPPGEARLVTRWLAVEQRLADVYASNYVRIYDLDRCAVDARAGRRGATPSLEPGARPRSDTSGRGPPRATATRARLYRRLVHGAHRSRVPALELGEERGGEAREVAFAERDLLAELDLTTESSGESLIDLSAVMTSSWSIIELHSTLTSFSALPSLPSSALVL